MILGKHIAKFRVSPLLLSKVNTDQYIYLNYHITLLSND